MIRKLGAAAVALLCVAGFAAVAEAEAPSAAKAPTARSVVAVHGDYHGLDHQQRTISLTYSGNEVKHFKVGTHTIGNAHVGGSAMWHETCHNGWCFKGHWQSDTHVTGFWKAPQGHWVPWAADVSITRTNFQGSYSGWDHKDNTVRFTRHNDWVQHFTVKGHTFNSARVTHGQIPETCNNGWCYRGHWQDDYRVAGFWKGPGEPHWVAWEVNALSAR